MVPPWFVTQILIGVAKVLPKFKLVPQKDLAELAFKDKKKKDLVGFLLSYKWWAWNPPWLLFLIFCLPILGKVQCHFLQAQTTSENGPGVAQHHPGDRAKTWKSTSHAFFFVSLISSLSLSFSLIHENYIHHFLCPCSVICESTEFIALSFFPSAYASLYNSFMVFVCLNINCQRERILISQ